MLHPGATGNLTEGRDGCISASISPAQSALSGPAVRTGGQGRSSSNHFVPPDRVSIHNRGSSVPTSFKRYPFSEVFHERQDGRLRSAHTKITDVKYSTDLFPMWFNSTSSWALLFQHEIVSQDESLFFCLFFLPCRNRLYFTKMLPTQKKPPKNNPLFFSSPVQMALEDSRRTAF